MIVSLVEKIRKLRWTQASAVLLIAINQMKLKVCDEAVRLGDERDCQKVLCSLRLVALKVQFNAKAQRTLRLLREDSQIDCIQNRVLWSKTVYALAHLPSIGGLDQRCNLKYEIRSNLVS
jgi:hypothetical protein